jgi:heat shock protein HtpX
MAYGLYTHIQSNKRRSIALLIGLFLLVYLMTFAGALLAEALSRNAPLGWLLRDAFRDLIAASPFVTIGTIIWILIAYKFHQSMIDAITGGHEVTRQEQPRLYNLLENLCISRGITMPKLKVMDSDALNAFATGMNERQYSITVTTALIDRLNDAELEAVLGHELTHIRNGDVRMLVIAVIIAGVVSFVAELVFRMLFQGGFRSSGRSDSRSGGGAFLAIIIAIAAIAVAWLLSVVIRFALSRQREYLADAGSIELTKNPDAMITALRKIENRGELEGATSAVMEMCIDNPRTEFADLFATHPSIDSRVEAIVRFAGGHDPGPIELTEVRRPQIDWDDPNIQRAPGGATPSGPTQPSGDKPFLPSQPPIDTGTAGAPGQEAPGPWGPHRR